MNGTCSAEGCERPQRARGYCSTHWGHFRRSADYTTGKKGGTAQPVRDRLLAAVVPAGDCWLFGTDDPGRLDYGSISVSGRGRLAHRASYETFVGPIPDGLQIDHLCRVRRCINPAHLEPVTARENTRRSPLTRASINASRTHCPQGHEYTPENTYASRHGRLCRRCNIDRARERYTATRQAVSA